MTKAKKPPSRRTNAKSEIEEIIKLFTPLLHKKVQFSFGKFSFPITIQDIKLAKLGDMMNKPEMRTDNNEKYTPPVMQFDTSDGKLYFILEDITVAGIANGVRIITAANNIDFREEK